MAHLSVLVAEFGEDIPYADALARGFPFRGRRVPFLNYQKGIYRAAVQSGPAALSIQTSSKSPYDDEIVQDGFLYAYRAGDIDQPDNRALRAAHILSDVLEAGEAAVQNGLSLCAIHHRAFDQNLVGVSPDYIVHVSRRLLEDEDGPMLDLLKGFHEVPLQVPTRAADRPDREHLGARFAQFLGLAA